MASSKAVLIVGATGRVGSSLVKQALEAGYRVTAVVRPDSRLPDDLSGSVNLKVLRGNLDAETLAAALEKPVTAVFTALSGADMPALHETICKAVKGKTGILVSVHAAGLLDTNVPRAAPDKYLSSVHDSKYHFNVELGKVPPFLVKVAAVHLASYKVIANSGVPYSVICPPNMPEGPKSEKGPAVQVGTLPAGGTFRATTGDVAAAMLMAVDTKDFHGRRVGVMTM